jgi:GNAT superfamily N-acetyltransferase
MNADIRIQAIGLPQRDLLMAMYDRFDPLGAALGLPPRNAEGRHKWIVGALGQIVNVAAFSRNGEVVGHCFVVADKPSSAEIAVFVHQEFRWRGIGAALLKKALEWGRAAGLVHAWAITASENRAALRLLTSCGFRLMRTDVDVAELEIDLRVPPNTRVGSGSVSAGAIGGRVLTDLVGLDSSGTLDLTNNADTHYKPNRVKHRK